MITNIFIFYLRFAFMNLDNFNIGDLVELKTKERTWKGYLLESYDYEIFLLKLENGYNIGLRKEEILSGELIKKNIQPEKKKEVFEKNKNLKNVLVIITGGTISSRLDPKTGGVISTDAEELLNMAPEIKNICNIVKIEKPFMKWSEDMSSSDWEKLAEVCGKYLNDEKIDGIIITHGTDFLHYTASALSFFIKNLNKPIALTCSQRSIDRGSTDAHLNLICAAKYAVNDIAEIALISHEDLNDKTCLALPATKVRKMHTSRRDTFKAINDSPIARISEKTFEILKDFEPRDNRKEVKIDSKFNDKVAVIKIVPGQDPSILDYYQENGYKGIILEVTGIGQVPGKDGKYNWLPKLKKLSESGTCIFAVAQTINGRLNPNVYSKGREIEKTGVIYLEDMLSETAFVKLGWILGHKAWYYDPAKIKEKMLENISHEFNTKIGF